MGLVNKIKDIYKTPISPFGTCRSKKLRNRRIRLYKNKKGKCYYCGTTTILDLSGELNNKPIHNLATIDHKYFRWDIRRALSEENVLSCWMCNQIKNDNDNGKMWHGFTYLGNEFNIFNYLTIQSNHPHP